MARDHSYAKLYRQYKVTLVSRRRVSERYQRAAPEVWEREELIMPGQSAIPRNRNHFDREALRRPRDRTLEELTSTSGIGDLNLLEQITAKTRPWATQRVARPTPA
jgi:hypothetical protein